MLNWAVRQLSCQLLVFIIRWERSLHSLFSSFSHVIVGHHKNICLDHIWHRTDCKSYITWPHSMVCKFISTLQIFTLFCYLSRHHVTKDLYQYWPIQAWQAIEKSISSNGIISTYKKEMIYIFLVFTRTFKTV